MGGIILCYANCEPCMYEFEHPRRPHTWMGDEDLAHAKRTEQVPVDITDEQLAQDYPCGCWCVAG